MLGELVAVLALAKDEARSLLIKVSVAAFAMIALGYPGEVAGSGPSFWIFFVLSFIPFAYILYVAATRLTAAVADQPENVKGLFGLAGNIVLVSWMFYPIAYLAPALGLGSATGEIALQVGYTFSDLIAKAGFGLAIFAIARAKSEADGFIEATPEIAAAATPATPATVGAA